MVIAGNAFPPFHECQNKTGVQAYHENTRGTPGGKKLCMIEVAFFRRYFEEKLFQNNHFLGIFCL